MPTIHSLDPAEDVLACKGMAQESGLTPQQWQEYCLRRGVVVFVVESDGEVVGLAVVESCRHRLQIRRLEGDADTCRLLLRRLVLLAGERDLTGWVAADRPGLRRLFCQRGFIFQGKGEVGGRPAFFYFWDRSSEL
jgi:hypothetical protein